MPFVPWLIFVFLLGACVGSFLNVVAWRLPRVEFGENDSILAQFYKSLRGLSTPPSHCPQCNTPLAWYDNLPIVGWIFLRGKCRYCKKPISIRYPIVELLTALLFALYFWAYFGHTGQPHLGPIAPELEATLHRRLTIQQDWPIFTLHLVLLTGLLAASLIDLELFIIPLEIPYAVAVIGIIVHTVIDTRQLPGAVIINSMAAMMISAGAAAGLAISCFLSWLGWQRRSFPKGEPIFEADRAEFEMEIAAARAKGETVEDLPPRYTRLQIRLEMSKEMAFLLPPMILAMISLWIGLKIPAVQEFWKSVWYHQRVCGLLGSLLGAMIGAFVVWIVRIFGTLLFGKVAMGLGDVHLMFGVGAVLGWLAATVAFFLAPFFGILTAFWMLLFHRRRELPYGPYLSLATAAVMLFWAPIAAYIQPGAEALHLGLLHLFGGN